MPGNKSKTLSLCEKLQLIEEFETRKVSARELALVYGVGKTQVYETLKHRERIKAELLNGTSGQRKRLSYVPLYEDVNKAMWEWFCKRQAEGLPVQGTMLQAQALKVAKELGKPEFKASNGWLDCFKARHNITCSINNEEVRILDKDVIVMIEEPYNPTIPEFTAGYSEENTFVLLDTNLCYKALSSSDDCSERVSVLLCMNMSGTLLKPLVVGKIARPKAFGQLDVATLPVQWRPNAQARMTNFLLAEWLKCFDQVMASENRMVVLVLSSPTLSYSLNNKVSNVKVVWSQKALDAGVVQYFKGLYRKSLLQTILVKSCCEVEQEPDVVKLEPGEVAALCSSITVLDAVCWISRAVSNIPPNLVRKSLVASGFVPLDEMVVPVDDAEASLRADIYELCQRLNLDAEEVLRYDDEVPEEGLLIKEELPPQEEEQSEIRTYSAAIKAVEDLEKFAALKNNPQLLNLLQDAKESLSQSCLGF